MKTNKGRNVKKFTFPAVIIASFFIKLILMPFSAHSDLFATQIFPPLLLEEKVIDIFGYLDNLGKSYFYPPLSYYLFAFFEYFLQNFSSTYLEWLNQMRLSYLNGLQGQADVFLKAVQNPSLFFDIFLAKTPLLIFDVASLIVLFKFVKERVLKSEALYLWILNPVIFYTTYIFGQFDIIVLFFILLGFYLIRKHIKLGILAFGFAGALKSYPFIIVLPLILIYGKDVKEKLKLLIIAFAPFVISIIPTLINSPQLVLFTFFPKNIFHYKQPLEGWEKYSQFIKYGSQAFSYLLLLLISTFIKLKDKLRTSIGISLIVVLLALTLAGRTHFHYLIWEMPLMILWFRNNLKFLTVIILIQTISFASYKILASQLQLGLFAPINPDYFMSLPTFNGLISQVISYRIVSTFGFVVFTSVNILLITKILFGLLFTSETKYTHLNVK